MTIFDINTFSLSSTPWSKKRHDEVANLLQWEKKPFGKVRVFLVDDIRWLQFTKHKWSAFLLAVSKAYLFFRPKKVLPLAMPTLWRKIIPKIYTWLFPPGCNEQTHLCLEGSLWHRQVTELPRKKTLILLQACSQQIRTHLPLGFN